MAEQPFRIGHLVVETPMANAGGVVKTVEDTEKMALAGGGWIEDGSHCLEERLGNAFNPETGLYDRVVYHHNPETGETNNSLGMPGKGMDVVEKEIPAKAEAAHKAGDFYKPLVVNVAPVTTDPVPETLELVTRAYEARADAVLLNAGCPNVITDDGGREENLSHNAEALELVLGGLKAVTDKYHKIFIRISPMDSIAKMTEITQVIRRSGVVSAVFVPNTWPNRPVDEQGRPLLDVPDGIGGKSGPITAREAVTQTAWVKHGLNGSGIDIVSSGGITTGKELAFRLAANGAAAGAGTTFFYESGDWKHDVDKLLWDLYDNL
jgi:dihydroorotate dehydrogenase